MTPRLFTDPVEAFMAQPGYIAEEAFIQRHIELYKQTDRYREYLKRRQDEEEKGQKPDDNEEFNDRRELIVQRADYIAEEEFKRRHREAFLKSSRFLNSDRGKEYMKQQTQQDKDTKTE